MTPADAFALGLVVGLIFGTALGLVAGFLACRRPPTGF